MKKRHYIQSGDQADVDATCLPPVHTSNYHSSAKTERSVRSEKQLNLLTFGFHVDFGIVDQNHYNTTTVGRTAST